MGGTEQMLCIKRHSSLAGVWREALEGLREADLAESAAAEALPASDYLSLSRYLSFFSFTSQTLSDI